MSKYLYLFRGGDARRAQQSPEEMQLHMAKWGTWMQGLAQSGKLVDGLPLAAEGCIVSDNGNVTTDGPFAEGSEVVGGYLIVNADTLEAAATLSRECPIFEHEGTVEVREILSM